MKQKSILSFWVIGLHVISGILSAYSPLIAKAWGIVVFLLGLYFITKNKNRNNEAALWSAYYVGLDVLLRMNNGAVFWEFGKYAVILLLGYGLSVERKKKYAHWVILIIVLLFPALLQTFMWSEHLWSDIMFNTSGMLALCMSAFYFYKRPVAFENLLGILSYYILPVISICFSLFVKTPRFSDITFDSTANFAMSGGFGPNQVATVLGMGWLIVLLFFLYKKRLTPYYWLDIVLFGFILYRALFTFSRGGNMSAVLALIGFFIIHLVHKNRKLISVRTAIATILIGIVSFVLINQINDATQGMFNNRFTGKSTAEEMKEDITSNRINILEQEMALFKEHPLGVGMGGSKVFRKILYHEEFASHNEFGRLLSEHGIFGILIMIILFYKPLSLFIKIRDIDNKAFLLVFCIISFSTMMHSAMRIVLPAFFYGLALIYLLPKSKN